MRIYFVDGGTAKRSNTMFVVNLFRSLKILRACWYRLLLSFVAASAAAGSPQLFSKLSYSDHSSSAISYKGKIKNF